MSNENKEDQQEQRLEYLLMKLRLHRLEGLLNDEMNCSKKKYYNMGMDVSYFNQYCKTAADEDSESEESEEDEEEVNNKLEQAIKKFEEDKKNDDENLEKMKEEMKKNNNRNFKVVPDKTEVIKANMKNRVGKKPAKAPAKIKNVKK